MTIVVSLRRSLLGALLPLCGVLIGMSALPARAQKTSAPPPVATGAPDWNTLRAAYAYDEHKKPVVKTEERPRPDAYLLHIEFTGPSGAKVTGLYARPRKEGVYPCVLLLHGWTSRKEDMALWIGPEILASGMSFLALDAPNHGERARPNTRLDFVTMWPTTTTEGVRDYRMAMLWLLDRKDVDSRRIGLFGYSMGSMMGSVLTGLEPRIQAAALCVGGDLFIHHIAELPADKRATAYTLSPSLFISHVAPRPVLLLNGSKDETVKAEASGALYAAAKEPKQQRMFDSGHILPKEALTAGVKWLAQKIGSGAATKNVSGPSPR
jgi:dienelactone hydrolase